MKIWIVWIKNNTLNLKWIDSIWASQDHANGRNEDVLESMKRGGLINYEILIWEAKISDAGIAGESPEARSE